MEYTYQLKDIDTIAQEIISQIPTKVVVFNGKMGMGKTTLIKALAKALGVSDMTSSPTFGLVNEYHGTQDTIYHFDFYRINDEMEALDMGVEEYFYSDAWCFIEWAEKIPSLLPDSATILNFEWVDEQTRKVSIRTNLS